MSESQKQFFSHVHPNEGLICIMGIGATGTTAHFFEDVDAAIAKAQDITNNHANAYYGVARYVDTRRLASNAKFFKTFWIDVDCGGTEEKPKPYATQEEGMKALVKFCHDVSLPYPTVVDSGNGLHCYWPVDEDITYNEWKPVAEALKNLCIANKFNVDHKVTSNAAQILRVPGTHNFKDKHNPKLVSVVKYSQPMRYSIFKELVGSIDIVAGTSRWEIDDTTKALLGYDKVYKHKFKTILEKSLKGTGCNQIRESYLNQEHTSYDQWLDILSIAQYCEDRGKAIHFVSRNNERYDPAETEFKANEMGGPHWCTTFEASRPGACEGCIHKGTSVNNPIKLGRYIPEAEPEDNLVTVVHAGLQHTVVDTIPTYPKPYFRPKSGGVAIYSALDPDRKPTEEEVDEDAAKIIYQHDLYVSKRLYDPTLGGEVVVIKHILPMDGLREFTVRLADLMSTDKLKNALGDNGVAVEPRLITAVSTYLIRFASALQSLQKAEVAREHFGWHDDNSCFIVGTRQINKLDVAFSPESAATYGITQQYSTAGTLERWIDVANLYAKPHNASRAFVLGLGFGAPFVKFSGVEGFVVHVMNQGSGQGKSTTQYMATSIWGNHKEAMKRTNDKVLARQHMMGVLRNLPACIDELSNLKSEEISELVFSASGGRGRDRMQSSSNALRRNTTSWRLPLITSGNNSLHDELMAYKAFPEGELMRVLEVKLPEDTSLTKEESDYWYRDVLEHNYGLACEPYIQYILNNFDECMSILRATQKAFDVKAGFVAKHRYYSTACAISLAGLKISKLCGLHSINVDVVEEWLLQEVKATTAVQEKAVIKGDSSVGAFINEHIKGMLVLDAEFMMGGIPKQPSMTPTTQLIMRYQPDTKKLFIDFEAFKTWCTRRRISSKQILEELTLSGVAKLVGRFSLGEGLPGIYPPTKVIEVVYALPEAIAA